jgi:hypothetical protein
VRGDDVRAAARAAAGFLTARTGRDWSAPVPGLDFTVASVVAHCAETVLWYALDLGAGSPTDDGALEVGVRAGAEPARLAGSLANAARLCALVVDGSPDSARGFHPLGGADPSGFAAMACDEILVHTADAAGGLGEEFRPDADLAARVLARLFPWHEPGDDPWTTLRWANGRLDLPGRPAQRDWRWHCAPLAEWDGTAPPGAR